VIDGHQHVFDSLDCAARSLGRSCAGCGRSIIGRGLVRDGAIYCSERCLNATLTAQSAVTLMQVLPAHGFRGPAPNFQKEEFEMTKLACADIGIEGCGFEANDQPGRAQSSDVLGQMVAHLRKAHGLKLSAQQVGEADFETLGNAERMVAARLHQQLEQQM
jgi:predicted small metal-binding protein